MDNMSKNGCFFEKKSSVYAGLKLGAIYSTLIKKIPEVIPPGFSYGCLLDTYNLLANGIIAYTVVKIKYAISYKKQTKNHVGDMSKNGCFFEKKSSVYAGLRLGAIYSTLRESRG